MRDLQIHYSASVIRTIESDPLMTYREMLIELRSAVGMTQKELAAALKISNQYLCDMEHGRRMPSVNVVEKICKWAGRGPRGISHWHIAAARAHGWKV